jgi:hypothetical protein
MNDANPDRREFLQATGAVAAGAAVGTAPASSQQVSKPWYQTAWRRAVIDMHIPDWDPQFLSKFDPDEYLARLVESRAQSIVCYAQSHVGLFNYPTKVGKQHAAFAGRDVIAELMSRCRSKEIAVVLYTSLIHDRWAYDQHPDWRMLRADGKPISEGGRHGLVCPNSPYREYVRKWVDEMARRYDAEGFRFDMTFWVGVCHCRHCKERWGRESKRPWPTKIDWTDEEWTLFAHRREEWLADFAAICTTGVRAARPNASVEHQASTLPLNWRFGVGLPLVRHNDFLQGDFYGDALQGSFVRKLLGELTPKKPFGFETSFSLNLADHTGRKSEALLESKASAAIADHAAFVFIDAIDPIGTVNPICHRRMRKVFDRLQAYYSHLGGTRVADVAVYYSLDSKFSMKTNGRPIAQEDASDDHTEAAMNVARRLIAGHVPFTVVTKKDLARLGEFKAILLPNVHHMSEAEASAIREFVRNGGAIYASGGTSLVSSSGKRQKDFMLAEVFGVSCKNARWDDRRRYLVPTKIGRTQGFGDWSDTYPAFIEGFGFDVAIIPTKNDCAIALATRTLPWPPKSPREFASIHSDPPWLATSEPEVTLHGFGKGKAIYSASLIENVEPLAETFVKLVNQLEPLTSFHVAAPACVEASLFRQPDRQRHVLSLVNFQEKQPNIPIHDVAVVINIPERIRRVTEVRTDFVITHPAQSPQVIRFRVDRLDTLAMFAIEWA